MTAQARSIAGTAALCLMLAAVTGCRGRAQQQSPKIVATNSYLQCAVRDLMGDDTPVATLAGPGMCPGHFDIRPSQVEQVRRARLVLRFDFQKSLDAKLAPTANDAHKIAEVRLAGGLCEPDSYLSACRQVAEALVQAGFLETTEAHRRIGRIGQRIDALARSCRSKTAPLKGTAVLSSVHQEAFCRWLGLSVVATFSAADTAGVGQVDRAVRQGDQAAVRFVIANKPEGRKLADALAQRLGAKVVVFDNFPAVDADGHPFDQLLEGNVERLLEAAGS